MRRRVNENTGEEGNRVREGEHEKGGGRQGKTNGVKQGGGRMMERREGMAG